MMSFWHTFLSFLSIYTAAPSREDYVQVHASKKRLIEESLKEFSKAKKYDSVSMKK